MRLDGQKQDPVGTTSTGSQPTIHNVHIVDASGSMNGDKYDSAISGINAELATIRQDSSVNYTITIVEFHGDLKGKLHTHYFMQPLDTLKGNFVGLGTGGMTPLYQVSIQTIEKLLQSIKNPEDRVILTIFTDGGENDSRHEYSATRLEKLVSDVQKENNFTITFMGTKNDVDVMVKNIHLRAKNTLVHLNNAQSIAASYQTRRASLMAYSKSVVEDGLTVSDEFFKSVDQ